MAEADLKDRRNGGDRGDVGNVVKITGLSNLPQEFITAGKTFQETLGRCTIIDERQRSAIILYKAQLDMFTLTLAIEDLTNWLNASSAVGGYNKSLAAMTHTGIYVPEGAGIRLSKQGSKEYMEAQRRKDEQSKHEGEKDDK